MAEPQPRREVPAEFWRQLADADQRVLALDYDGTLAPFTVERDEAWPYPGVREQLDAIAADGQTRLVVVSGRSADNVKRLLGLEHPIEIWGSHGHERLLPNGTRLAAPLRPQQEQALRDGRIAAEAYARPESVEAKPACVAVHWRGEPGHEAQRLENQLRKAWGPLSAYGLDVFGFDGGLELRSTAVNKGTVIDELLSSPGNKSAVAYLGDDLTDEDAFQALRGRGLSVLVRPEYRETAAELWIRPPEELLLFLAEWVRVLKA